MTMPIQFTTRIPRPPEKGKIRPAIEKLIASKKGILLDISFGGDRQPRSVSLGPGGDIVADPRSLPLPLPAACVHSAVIVHVLEYLPPEHWFAWWDDLHRVMLPHGVAYVSGPYGGDDSQGWLSDPTHRTRVVEQSFAWLDPRMPFYATHGAVGRQQPRPWYTLGIARIPGANGTLGYNCTLQAVPVTKAARVKP